MNIDDLTKVDLRRFLNINGVIAKEGSDRSGSWSWSRSRSQYADF